ncbi:MAG TPA: hypothetical protein VHB50_04290, partial [Bryobacteraceae bacterium]|nr:hypothetical protein [Bryobacteraceae bacterium]
VFLSGGIEKLRNAGFRWADGKSFRSYLIRHHLISGGNAALWLARRPGLCRFFSTCVLAWELTFWMAVLSPLAGTVWAVFGILFLVSTAILMRIHYWIYFGPLYFAFLTPWICAKS